MILDNFLYLLSVLHSQPVHSVRALLQEGNSKYHMTKPIGSVTLMFKSTQYYSANVTTQRCQESHTGEIILMGFSARDTQTTEVEIVEKNWEEGHPQSPLTKANCCLSNLPGG